MIPWRNAYSAVLPSTWETDDAIETALTHYTIVHCCYAFTGYVSH